VRGLSNEKSRIETRNSQQGVILYLIITFLLGALTVLGFAPFYLFPVPVFTIASLLYFWRKSASPLQAALLGFCFGMGMFGAGVTWIYISLHEFGSVPIPISVFLLIILCAYLSLYITLTGWMVRRLYIDAPLLWVLFVASLWTLSEWLRGVVSFFGFPWLTVGYSQVPSSPLAGYSAVTGVYGVSLILVLSAAFISLFFEKELRSWRNILFLPVIWIIGFGLQFINWTEPQGGQVSVSLLQGNISQEMKWRPEHVINTMDTYAELAHTSNSRLIIAPEISLPLSYNEVPANYLAKFSTHAKQNSGDILIGMVETAGNSGNYYNSMFSFGVSSEQVYRKYHLLPFGEFIPLKPLFGWIINILKIPLTDFSRGELDQKPMNLAGQSVAVNICYEDAFGEELIYQLPQATLLANVSNDAWFGRSIGPHQHLQISQMRALETGRYMLRATNTGVSAIINERGVVLQQADVFATTVLNGMVQGYTGATPYVRFGNSLVLGFVGLSLLICLVLIFRGTRKTL
jgi:apolipoprotein N-acyltransferase